jgi:hypothetical protein
MVDRIASSREMAMAEAFPGPNGAMHHYPDSPLSAEPTNGEQAILVSRPDAEV